MTNTDAPLQVTQADRDLVRDIERLMRMTNSQGFDDAWQLAARHRAAFNVEGADALREAADKFDKLAASLRETEPAALAQEIAVCELGREECRDALASLNRSQDRGDGGLRAALAPSLTQVREARK